MASSSSPRQYDVFLSFRGEDTRRTFVGHLYNGLQTKGIITFKDNLKLQTGDSISDELPKAIEESKFAVVVISQNYASSSWCLDELQLIMERHKKKMLNVLPIFYGVDPSHVRKQTGTFADAFKKYDRPEMTEKVGKWREALAEVAGLTGVNSRDCEDDAIVIDRIVVDILKRLFSLTPRDTSDIIGMDAHLEALAPLLSMGSNDEVRMIGIWGMGGIGKTTVASCLYDQLKCQFSFHCFIDNVKKIYSEHGVKNLQRRFLSKILRDESLMSESFEIDSNTIKARLQGQKVLAILDDVDKLDQLQVLAKETSWFGPGSRIIITTRDKGSLNLGERGLVYKVKCLGDDAALRLFSHFAFREAMSNDQVPNGFAELSIRAIHLVDGLPLALRVLGSFLRGRTIQEWKNAIHKLSGGPRKDITECLKMSYDGLDERNKGILLTVACLFNEERVRCVSKLLDGEEWEIQGSLKMLAEKALIDVSYDGQLIIHDLIQEMAKEIVYEQSPNDPGRCRFLWDANKIYNVLEEGTGTNAIEGISLNMSEIPRFPTRNRAFENMRNLKFLKIHNTNNCEKDLSQIRSALNHLPRGLRLLEWRNCPLATLPSGFRAKRLVELRLPDGRLERLSEETLFLGNLRRMDLSQCHDLKEFPSLCGATKLEELNLDTCQNLGNIPDTIGSLTALEDLTLRGCRMLSEIPNSIGNLTILKVLDLDKCMNLVNIPDTIGCLTALERLMLSECSMLSAIPNSIGNLRALKHLEIRYCTKLRNIPDTIESLTALEDLTLSGCEMLSEIPSTIGNLVALKVLDLDWCKNLVNIPNTIGSLTALEHLRLGGCGMLSEIPSTIGNLVTLKVLELDGCENLVNIPDTIGCLTALERLMLSECSMLSAIPNSIGNLRALKRLHIILCVELKNIPNTIGSLTALEHLELNGCGMLSEIPSTIGNLVALKVLELDGCENLVNIPDTIGCLTALEGLIVQCCSMLSAIPNSIGNLRALKCLDIRFCPEVKNIPDTIGSLTALEDLTLSDCGILSEIPSMIGNLAALKVLHLDECKNVVNVPDTIGSLTTLEHLDLNGWGILSEIPSTIGNLVALKVLELDRCENLVNIPDTIGCLTALERLMLSECSMLSAIPNSIGNLRALKHLEIRYCTKLRNIPDTIGSLTALEDLTLSGCEMLSEIPSTIGNLVALKVLDLDWCKNLVSIPDTIGSLTALQILKLSYCSMLSAIPNSIGNLRALKRLRRPTLHGVYEYPGHNIENLNDDEEAQAPNSKRPKFYHFL